MPKLFLLKPDFTDNMIDAQVKFYCPDCAMVQGIIGYYPKLKDLIEIIYVDFERPRKKIIKYIGEENQGCPVLIVGKHELNDNIVNSYFKAYNDYLFIDSANKIAKYLTENFRIGLPHP